eukprot:CAMPEP_0183729002 /NCGR_PEP_ID=MMETSP0737-20130205/29470_1 /TAXON_ID=385413 /ORGANISM="Thalassiosira miniscula, Strain CCMP1093" /LENGTH=200 /DNA_ID=CAMNT_0025961087 /DNA_START=53 /DNA_END=652 /DNA_ORIENTATION=+
MAKGMASNVDFSGDANSHISRVGVIVSNIEGADPALRGFLGAVDWAGRLFVGNVHRHERLQSWLTHFALVIEFAQSNVNFRDLWLLERGVDGVTFKRLHEHEFQQGFRWELWQNCDNFFPNGTGSGSSKLLCHIYSGENHVYVTRESVWRFVREQMQMGYHILGKNCKHFAYDFYYYCIQNSWVKSIDFPAFSETIEAGW